MATEIDISSPEGDIYKALKDAVPVVKEAVSLTVAVVKLLYGIGNSDEIERVLSRLARDQEKLRAMLVDVRNQLNALVQDTAVIKNRVRMDFIAEQAVEITTLSLKLQNPANTVHDFKAIAAEALLRASRFLELERWMFSDVKTEPAHLDEDGVPVQEVTRTLPDRFVTSFALPVYSMALAVFVTAASRHLVEDSVEARRAQIEQTYQPALDEHIAATSLRFGWIDDHGTTVTPDQSLHEIARKCIFCAVLPDQKYAENGKCQFTVYAVDLLRGERKEHRRFELTYEDHGRVQLCTYPEGVTWADEQEVEEASRDLQLFQLWSEALTHFRSTARLPGGQQYQGVFPNWTAVRADLYVVKNDGQLIAARQTWPRTVTDFEEKLAVGTAWHHGKVVHGGGTTLYLGYPDGNWSWYRHKGAEQPTLGSEWQERHQIGAPQGRGWFANRRVFGGGDGVLYGIVKADELRIRPGGQVNVWPKRGMLMWIKHDDFLNGTGGFSEERLVDERNWDGAVKAFGMGYGVIYTVTADGALHWHRHTDYRTGGSQWQPSKQVGTGWLQFEDVFGAGQGLIYARFPNGRTLVYRHHGWQDGAWNWDHPVELIETIDDRLAFFAALPDSVSPIHL